MALDGVMGDIIIPNGICSQYSSAYDPTNGIGEYAYMDIVRSNIKYLMHRDGLNENELADRSGAGQTWIHRYMKGTIQKANPEKMALIAKVFGYSAADLMWTDLTNGSAASQPVGTEQRTLDAAVKLVELFEAMSPTPPPKALYSGRLFIALQVVQEAGAEGILDGTMLVEATKSLAARLRATG